MASPFADVTRSCRNILCYLLSQPWKQSLPQRALVSVPGETILNHKPGPRNTHCYWLWNCFWALPVDRARILFKNNKCLMSSYCTSKFRTTGNLRTHCQYFLPPINIISCLLYPTIHGNLRKTKPTPTLTIIIETKFRMFSALSVSLCTGKVQSNHCVLKPASWVLFCSSLWDMPKSSIQLDLDFSGMFIFSNYVKILDVSMPKPTKQGIVRESCLIPFHSSL